jgi:hypothetical protein
MPLTPPLFWLALGGVLLLLVLLGIDSDGLLAIGGVIALTLAAIASLVGLPPVVQGLLFIGLVALGYAGLRRWSAARGSGEIPPSSRAELAEVIDGFDAHGEGRVLWQGQSWAALSLEPGRPLPRGSRVLVLGREGTRLQVMPRPSLRDGA